MQIKGISLENVPVKHMSGELLPLAVSAVVQQGSTVGL